MDSYYLLHSQKSSKIDCVCPFVFTPYFEHLSLDLGVGCVCMGHDHSSQRIENQSQ